MASQRLERDTHWEDRGQHIHRCVFCASEPTSVLQFANVGLIADCVRFLSRARKLWAGWRRSGAIVSSGRASS